MKKEAIFYVVLLSIIAALLLLSEGSLTGASSSGSNESANLTIYDEIDLNGNIAKLSNSRLAFYANYTNSSGAIINETQGSGACSISFNFNSSFTEPISLFFNSSGVVWQYNRSFIYKGTHMFRVNCTSAYGNLTLNDTYVISNTAPKINLTNGGVYIDFDGNLETSDLLSCTEDSLCTYNFSGNITDPDINDVLTYNYTINTNTTLTNFSMNSSSSILTINITTSSLSGPKQIELNVRDSESQTIAGILRVNISAVNDVPQFSNLQNQTFNISSIFSYTITTTDEENNSPYSFNITFLSCSVAPWSSRNCSTAAGRELFNSSQYSVDNTAGTLNITFTPGKNDVGNYTINFTVTDSGNPNGTTSRAVTFFVNNVNTVPSFTYVCDSERLWNETERVVCRVNVTDIDETTAITISSNYSWFTFNGGASTSTVGTSTGNASFVVNFTVTNTEVGRWHVNISANDSAVPSGLGSTVVQFNISNLNDSVFLNVIQNITAYTTNNYTLYVNASDNDLLIPDKNVYNEFLRFSSNVSCVAVSSLGQISSTNITQARIQFNASDSSCFTSGLNYTVRIIVNDSNNFSSFSQLFVIRMFINSQPQWNISTTNISGTEGILLYLNFSQNASDPQNDPLNFTFSNDTSFPSFSLGTTTGVLNFTPDDADVGLHYVNITISDNSTSARMTFNFTILNVNDAPIFETPLQANNATINTTTSAANTSEDKTVQLFLFIEDEDLKIPDGQRAYYNESFAANTSVQGANQTLLAFGSPSFISSNRTRFSATFIPRKADVGNYNITVNVTDASNVSVTFNFTIRIDSTNHAPSIVNLSNQSIVFNGTFVYDINATDTEDGSDASGNLTFSYVILSNSTPYLHALLNVSGAFNVTSGVISITFNASHVGIYNLNISVRDIGGLNGSSDFWIFVYDAPIIIFPDVSVQFSLRENNTANITFTVNHTVGNNLTYIISIANNVLYNASNYGNRTNVTWAFTPNFTDETYGIPKNLTLLVQNSLLPQLNVTRTWNITINHTNAPVIFSSTIPNRSATIVQIINYTLTAYFSDIDVDDPVYNQSLTYNASANNNSNGITHSVLGHVITFYPSATPSNATFTITSNDSQYNATSNTFFVDFTAVSTTGSSSSSSGGGGGSSSTASVSNPVSLKIILPDPVSLDKKDKIILPITLLNSGSTTLNGITLLSSVALNGTLRSDVISYFDRTTFATLASGGKESVLLTVETNTDEEGLFEITINASVRDPVYHDWGKLYIRVKEGLKLEERILFVNEFIVGNPECAELKEIVDEAKDLLNGNDLVGAELKVEEALAGCKQAIAQRPRTNRLLSSTEKIFSSVAIASLAAFALGIFYYFYQRIQLKRVIEQKTLISSFSIH